MAETRYSAPAISCNHCKHAIEVSVGRLEGVDEVVVDVTGKSVRVRGTAPESAVAAAIADAGYDATLLGG